MLLNKRSRRLLLKHGGYSAPTYHKPDEYKDTTVKSGTAKDTTKDTSKYSNTVGKSNKPGFNLKGFQKFTTTIYNKLKAAGNSMTLKDIEDLVYVESSGIPSAKNLANGKAGGLIQVFPLNNEKGTKFKDRYRILNGHKYKIEDIINTDYEGQIDIAVDYFKESGQLGKDGKKPTRLVKDRNQMYMSVFAPAYMYTDPNKALPASMHDGNGAYVVDGKLSINNIMQGFNKRAESRSKSSKFKSAKHGIKTNKTNIMAKVDYVSKYGTRVRKFEEGGAAPAPGQDPAAAEAEGQQAQGIEQQLMQLLEPVVQSQDPNQALEACNALYEALTGGQGGGQEGAPVEGGGAPPEGTPMARRGMKTGRVFSSSIKNI